MEKEAGTLDTGETRGKVKAKRNRKWRPQRGTTQQEHERLAKCQSIQRGERKGGGQENIPILGWNTKILI